jgi:hypothetical protein
MRGADCRYCDHSERKDSSLCTVHPGHVHYTPGEQFSWPFDGTGVDFVTSVGRFTREAVHTIDSLVLLSPLYERHSFE